MSSEKTVFILGAGASKTYGFPLGEELRRNIVKSYGNIISQLQGITKNTQFQSNSYSFRDHFEKSGDVSIDLFLSKFHHHSEVGIIAILYFILTSETQSQFLDRLYFNYKEQKQSESLDDWMWYLYSRLTRNLNVVETYQEIDFNNISFITFNYDRSLEHFFFERLSNGFNYNFIGGSADDVMKTLGIQHIYGQAALLPWQVGDTPKLEYGKYNVDQINLEHFTKNISLIRQRTLENKSNIHKILKEAHQIFFLGFSYDETNLKVLDIPNVLSRGQQVYGTAVGFLDEEIEDLKKYFYQKNVDSPGAHKHHVVIENVNCTTLLRKYFRHN